MKKIFLIHRWGGTGSGGWFDLINLEPKEMEIAHTWINSEIHFERILDPCDNFLAFFSDDDQYVHLDEIEKLKKSGRKNNCQYNKKYFEEV